MGTNVIETHRLIPRNSMQRSSQLAISAGLFGPAFVLSLSIIVPFIETVAWMWLWAGRFIRFLIWWRDGSVDVEVSRGTVTVLLLLIVFGL